MMIKTLVKEPGRPPVIREVENELEPFQKIVGGYIEVLRMSLSGGTLLLVCNEEGKLKGLAPNVLFGGDIIAGTVAVVRRDGEEFASLTEMDVAAVTAYLSHGQRMLERLLRDAERRMEDEQ